MAVTSGAVADGLAAALQPQLVRFTLAAEARADADGAGVEGAGEPGGGGGEPGGGSGEAPPPSALAAAAAALRAAHGSADVDVGTSSASFESTGIRSSMITIRHWPCS